MQVFESLYRGALRGDPVSIAFLAVFVGVGLFALWHFLRFCYMMTRLLLEGKTAKPEEDFPESQGRAFTDAQSSGIRGLSAVRRSMLLGLFWLTVGIVFSWGSASTRVIEKSYIVIVLAIILILISAAFAMSNALSGSCPYCGGKINAVPRNNEINCLSCKKHIFVRNRKFWTEAIPDNPE